MNPNNEGAEDQPVDCCICINSMAPFQALFLAPCSHTFHYKCVTPLLGAGFMFQCPLCRQVCNLEASVQDAEDFVQEIDDGLEKMDGPRNVGNGSVLMETDEPSPNSSHLDRSDENIATSPMDIPGTMARDTSAPDGLISPSTPMNSSVFQARVAAEAVDAEPFASSESSHSQMEDDLHDAQVYQNIFRSLNTMSAAVSNRDQSEIDASIENYSSQIRATMDNMLQDADSEVQRAFMVKMATSIQNALSNGH